MKKLMFITTVAGIFIAQINTHAQGLYVGIGGGYGFPSQVQAFYPGTSSSGGSTTYTSKSVSLGSGGTVGVYGGYMLTKNIGLELGISDKFSSSTSSTTTSSDTSTFGTTKAITTGTDVYTIKGSLFRLTPGIRVMVGDGKLQTYMVTGLIIGFPSATLEDAGNSNTIETTGSTVISNTTNVTDEIWTYSGGLIIGFHGAVGVVYMVTDKIGIFGELSGNFQNWAPSQSLVTTATVNGADQLSTWTTSQKQTNYVSSYTTSASSSSPGSPTQSTLTYLPFSSFGINIGVHINLGGGGGAGPK